MDRLLSMRTFAKVVDEGSFTGAAKEMLLDQAVVTRHVASLERHLGVQLLTRTTRSLRLTEAGEAYLARCRHIIEAVDAAETQIASGHGRIAGRVKMAMPLSFGQDIIAPRLKYFRSRFPEVLLDISLLDHPVDLASEGYDLAITASNLGLPGSVISRPLVDLTFGMFASCDYLKQAGSPRTPEDLNRHACICHSQERGRDQWKLTHENGRVVTVPINAVLWSNSIALTRKAVRDGLGVGILCTRAMEPEVKAGALAEVLPRWRLETLSFTLIYPSRDYVPARVRALIDFIVDGATKAKSRSAARQIAEANNQAIVRQ